MKSTDIIMQQLSSYNKHVAISVKTRYYIHEFLCIDDATFTILCVHTLIDAIKAKSLL